MLGEGAKIRERIEGKCAWEVLWTSILQQRKESKAPETFRSKIT